MTRSLQCEVYQTVLRQLRMGVPLFEPTPSNYDYVRPGDVGYVDKKGSFQRIFNAFNPSDSPVNRGCKLPEGFNPVPQDHQELSSSAATPTGSLIAMNDVRSIEANASLKPWSGASVSASMSFSISRSGSRSAGLYIRQSATCVDTVSDIHIKRYILENYSSWFTLIYDKLGREVRVQDIILVTGCHLTAEWAMGVLFWQTTSGSFGLGAGGPVGGTLSAAASTSRNFSLLLSQSGSGDPATASRRDQCIFARGFYVKERLGLWPRAIRASADPEDLDMDKNTDNAPSVLAIENNHDSDEEEHNGKNIDHHDLTLDVILKFSHADIAIAHEYDVCALVNVTNNNIGGISNLSELQEVGADIVVEFDWSLKLNGKVLTLLT
ncbi:hypothetical protein M0805_008210 [Coniferiporia weirii]|nr:hypothetical protein M0805_008210 [Coniferiporia weirii]